jgi:hypothetical protein
MGRARLAGVAALAMLFAGVAGGSPPPLHADPEGDVSHPSFDVVSFDAGVLPAGSAFAVDGVDAGTQLWGLFEFADTRRLLLVIAIPHTPDRVELAGATSAFALIPGEPEVDQVPDGLEGGVAIDTDPRHPPVPAPVVSPFVSHPNAGGVDELGPDGSPTGAEVAPDHPTRIHGVDMRRNLDGSLDVIVTRGSSDVAFASSVDVFGLDGAGNALVFAEWRRQQPEGIRTRAHDHRTGESPGPGSVRIEFLPAGDRVLFRLPNDLLDEVVLIQAQSRQQADEGGPITRSFTDRLPVPDVPEPAASSLRGSSRVGVMFALGIDPAVLGYSRSFSVRYPDPSSPSVSIHVGGLIAASVTAGTETTSAFQAEDSERSFSPDESGALAARSFAVEPRSPDDTGTDTPAPLPDGGDDAADGVAEETDDAGDADDADGTASPEAPEDAAGSAFPWVVVVLLVGALAALGAFLWWRSQKGDCADELAAWSAAKKRCETARGELAAARAYLDAKGAALDGLRGELDALERAGESSIEERGTTYHRIPGGRVTPEGLEEVMTAKRDQVRSAEDAVRTAEESVGAWQERVEEHCAEEEAARARYEECVGQAQAPPVGAGEPAEPAAEVPAEDAARPEPATGEQPAPPVIIPEEQPGPTETAAPDEIPPPPDETAPPPPAGRCRDGDERWEEFDGPHPFEILDPDGRVKLAVSYSIGSRRGIPLPTVDQYLPTASDRTMGYDDLASVTDDQLEAAFGPLQKVFGKAKDVAREPPALQVTLTLHVVQVLATCDRKLRCVDGEWQVTRDRRCTVTRTSAKPRRDFARATISGASKDVVKEVKAVFDQARAAIERSRPLDEYCAACREGKRS